jgi:hypothetical protein
MSGGVGIVAGETCGRPLVGSTGRLLGVMKVMTWCLMDLKLVHRLSPVAIGRSLQAGCSVVFGRYSRYTSKGTIV